MTEKKKKQTIKQLTAKFWELSRSRQEAFLKEIYQISPQNKDFFQIWLGKNNKVVLDALKKEIKKETIQRIPRYKKLRLSKLNEILRNAEKYALPILDRIELKEDVWKGILEFIFHKKWIPDRYEIACSRHLDQYIVMIQHHVLETSEQEEILKKTQKFLQETIQRGSYLPHIEDVYLKHFHS